jgi:hypothetical protein
LTTSQRDLIEARLAEWRALSDERRGAQWRAVLVDRVVSSMAMEGEPVSEQWIIEVKKRQKA